MKCITQLADGNEQAEEILTHQVLEWGVGGLFFFTQGPDLYPSYFRGENIVRIAQVLHELDGGDEGKQIREFMRFLMWQQRNLDVLEELREYFKELGMWRLWEKFGPIFGAIFPKKTDIDSTVHVKKEDRIDSYLGAGILVKDSSVRATAKCQNCGGLYDPDHGYSLSHCTQKCFQEALKALDSKKMFTLGSPGSDLDYHGEADDDHY